MRLKWKRLTKFEKTVHMSTSVFPVPVPIFGSRFGSVPRHRTGTDINGTDGIGTGINSQKSGTGKTLIRLCETIKGKRSLGFKV